MGSFIYANGDPVGMIDPTGLLSNLSSFAVGSAVGRSLAGSITITRVGISTIQAARLAAAFLFAVAALSVAAVTLDQALQQAREEEVETDSDNEEERRKRRGRIQIQGDDLIKGWGSDTPKALQYAWPGIARRPAPTKVQALLALRANFSKLSRGEQKNRAKALQMAVAYILRGPHPASTISASPRSTRQSDHKQLEEEARFLL